MPCEWEGRGLGWEKREESYTRTPFFIARFTSTSMASSRFTAFWLTHWHSRVTVDTTASSAVRTARRTVAAPLGIGGDVAVEEGNTGAELEEVKTVAGDAEDDDEEDEVEEEDDEVNMVCEAVVDEEEEEEELLDERVAVLVTWEVPVELTEDDEPALTAAAEPVDEDEEIMTGCPFASLNTTTLP